MLSVRDSITVTKLTGSLYPNEDAFQRLREEELKLLKSASKELCDLNRNFWLINTKRYYR